MLSCGDHVRVVLTHANLWGCRKKTDSGSSNGSGKPKEPWPLLNSNRNSNQLGTANTAKEDSESVTGYGDAVTETKQSRNGVSHSPSNSSVSKMK